MSKFRIGRGPITFAVVYGLLLSLFVSGMVRGPLPAVRAADADGVAYFMLRYDVDSSSVAYCNVRGTNGTLNPIPFKGVSQVATSGSSTTVTSTAGFGDLDADDIIQVTRALTTGVTDVRRVVGNPASSSSLTIDTAIDWSGGFAWSYLKQTCGTAATDGWIEGSGGASVAKLLSVDFTQGDIDGLDWRLETKPAGPGFGPRVIFPGTASACGAGSVASGYCRFATATMGTVNGNYDVGDQWPWKAYRLGFKFQSTDASDAGANLELVNAMMTFSSQQK